MGRQQAHLVAHQQRLEASRAAGAQVISEYAELRPTTCHPGVEQLVGLDQICDRLAVLTREVREEFLTFAPGGPQTAENMAASRPLNEDLLCRGGAHAHDLPRQCPYEPAHRRTRHLAGPAVRPGPHGCVPADPDDPHGPADRRTAMLSVSSDDTAAGAVLLTGQGTLTALCALFETTWEAARPLGEIVPTGPNGRTGQQTTALGLLAGGHTDEAIAKRLGVSPRTARRIASELMDRLDARSRFEAGVRAVQQGWLPPRP